MKKNIISSNIDIKVKLPETAFASIIGSDYILISGSEMKIYKYLVNLPSTVLEAYRVEDGNIRISAQQWVDNFDAAIAVEMWNKELKLQEASAAIAYIEDNYGLPF